LANGGMQSLAVRKPIKTTSEKVESILRNGLHYHWNDYLLYRQRFLKKGSPGSVHKLRVSIRKLTSQLKILQIMDPSKNKKKLIALIHQELKSLSHIRDLQVQCTEVEKYSHLLKTKLFTRHLARTEKKEVHKAQFLFEDWNIRKREKYLQKIDNECTRRFSSAKSKELARDLERLKKILEMNLQTLEADRLHLREGHDKDFHKFRVEVKDFLYKLENLKHIMTFSAALSEKMKKRKTLLGHLQDRIVLRDGAKDFTRKSIAHPHPRRELKQQIRDRQRAILQ
jgi:CHAD domain-containing protein